MFELDWAKLVVIGVVALIAIGPKELPTVLRTVGQWMTKIRRMAAEFQGQFQEAMREAEMADLKKQVDEISGAAKDLTTFDPLKPSSGGSSAAGSTSSGSSPAASGTTADSTASPQEDAETMSKSPDGTPAELDLPLPEPVPPVTEKDLASTGEAKPAPAQPQARDHPA